MRSWLCELAELAFEQEGNDLGSLQGYVDDSGEGRWMMADGIEMAVPTPALAASPLRPLLLAARKATTRPACSPPCATSSAATR